MRLSSITEMAAKKYCPNCGKTMSGNHYWYKGGWRCKGGGKPADAVQGSDMPRGAEPRQTVPAGFAEKIASLPFGTEISLKDGTVVRYLGGGKGAAPAGDPGETLYPVRIASGPGAGQLIMVRPDEIEI